MTDINITPGQSGYFSRPSTILDPHLFDGEHLKPDVRTRLNDLLLNYLNSKYHNADSWTTVWLAGSGIGYQWNSARGNGDLDVLFGIDYDKFVNSNPDFAYSTREEIVEDIDKDLKRNLWPKTVNTIFTLDNEVSGYIAYNLTDVATHYEVTFFLNPDVTAEDNAIVNIHPYAAYNLTTDEWTVKPAKQPQSSFPKEFQRQAQDNLDATIMLAHRYKGIVADRAFAMPGSAQYVNSEAALRHVRAQAQDLMDTIHLGRKAAFQPGGEGFGDFYNYQWQAAKRDGIVTTLNQIIGE